VTSARGLSIPAQLCIAPYFSTPGSGIVLEAARRPTRQYQTQDGCSGGFEMWM